MHSRQSAWTQPSSRAALPASTSQGWGISPVSPMSGGSRSSGTRTSSALAPAAARISSTQRRIVGEALSARLRTPRRPALGGEPQPASELRRVAARGEEGAGADRDPLAAGAHPGEHEVLAALVVARAVDERQPADRRAALQVEALDRELVVAVGVVVPALGDGLLRGGVGTLAERRVLGQRHRVGDGPGVDRVEDAVGLDRRDGDELHRRVERGERRLGVGGGHRGEVDGGVGGEAGDRVAPAGEVAPRRVDVLDRGREVRLVLAAVDDRHRVPGAQQLLDQREADEPGSAEDEYAHGCPAYATRRLRVSRAPAFIGLRVDLRPQPRTHGEDGHGVGAASREECAG